MLEMTALAPCLSSVRSIYLISGVLQYCSAEMHRSSILAQFQQQLYILLKGTQDHSTQLICLATFAKLSRIIHGNAWEEKLDGVSDTKELTSTTDIAQQLFGAKRAAKTLSLIVIGVIQSISSTDSSDLIESQIKENLGLTNEIIAMVDGEQKLTWTQTPRNAQLIRKLCEKLLHRDLSNSLRLAAFPLIVSLIGSSNVPFELISLLKDDLSWKVDAGTGEDIPQTLSPELHPEIFEMYTTQLFAILPRSRCTTFHEFQCLFKAREIILSLEQATNSTSDTNNSLPNELKTFDPEPALQRILEESPVCLESDFVHTDHEICPQGLWHKHVLLKRKICALFLRLIYKNRSSLNISSTLVNFMLEECATLPAEKAQCREFSRDARLATESSITYYAPRDLKIDLHVSQDWRSRLEKELDIEASHQRDMIIKRIDAICGDLQNRSDNVERPLQVERQKIKELNKHLEDSKAIGLQLQGKTEEQAMIIRGLEAENRRLADEIDSAAAASAELSSRNEDLKLKFEHLKVELSKANVAASERAEENELELLATRAAKDQIIDDQSKRCNELNNHAQYLTSVVEKSAVQGESLRVSAIADREEIGKLKEANKKLLEDMSLLRGEAERLRETTQSEIHTKDQELATQLKLHDSVLSTLKAESELEKKEIVVVANAYKQQLGDLMAQIDSLKKERSNRAREFAEAQHLSRKLIAITGNSHSTMNESAYQSLSHDVELDLSSGPKFECCHKGKAGRSTAVAKAQTSGETNMVSLQPTISPMRTWKDDPAKQSQDLGRRESLTTGRRPLSEMENTNRLAFPSNTPKAGMMDVHAPTQSLDQSSFPFTDSVYLAALTDID